MNREELIAANTAVPERAAPPDLEIILTFVIGLQRKKRSETPEGASRSFFHLSVPVSLSAKSEISSH